MLQAEGKAAPTNCKPGQSKGGEPLNNEARHLFEQKETFDPLGLEKKAGVDKYEMLMRSDDIYFIYKDLVLIHG